MVGGDAVALYLTVLTLALMPLHEVTHHNPSGTPSCAFWIVDHPGTLKKKTVDYSAIGSEACVSRLSYPALGLANRNVGAWVVEHGKWFTGHVAKVVIPVAAQGYSQGGINVMETAVEADISTLRKLDHIQLTAPACQVIGHAAKLPIASRLKKRCTKLKARLAERAEVEPEFRAFLKEKVYIVYGGEDEVVGTHTFGDFEAQYFDPAKILVIPNFDHLDFAHDSVVSIMMLERVRP
jgi:hypothetical protein